MKGIIIYKSNYGSTEQYARWIGETTGFKAINVKDVKKSDITDSDAVVFGCPNIAGKPLLAKWIEKRKDLLSGKKLALFTTSGADAKDPVLQKGFEAGFSPELRKELKYFPQNGRMIFSELSGMHKFLMRLGQKMVKDPAEKEEMVRDKDNMDRSGLKDLLEYLA
ncbi:flavodoxin domain-containing protein [Spirochaeta isovalerica]|uniref:Menaquinone-dependent protoporphyrinogen IX oxidase n=1 Tax=Spirochaeta isovalerica TaxID=150 RepID=A0A841R7E0_9SPIO|nr:flavodoxin domain-containing protein [Spirochaeta isovalerica]MBB6479746.1 menaquinone-dependent protoporphyrinogen IX oxidase [Spirochaeta isovalerica]